MSQVRSLRRAHPELALKRSPRRPPQPKANDGAPKDAAPKAKAVKPDPPKTAAQEPAQKAAVNAAPAPAVLVVVVPTATSLAVAVPVAVAPAAGPPQAYVLPQAGVPQQAYAAPQAYTSPQGYAPAQAYASQGVGARNLPTGGSYMAVAGGEAATMVSPLVVHGRVPQTSPVAVQASAIGNYATGIDTGQRKTLSQPMNITTEVDVGVDKAVVNTYTHTEVTLSRGDKVRENADDDNGTDSDDNGDNNNNGDESDEDSDN
ncbi:MAG: hypothetical protein M1830_002404 [Pleopsidium flavum]|nr:MAG: hypothetical protein M1830_002404 [Pleopsidium flavum]